ncbi:Fic/DOC family protein [Actinokineospora globicatena]|uniref:protein adenylyltransferase n=1 Tax=Actinokineospora globicatena TaxID=103729 RepID=A0A9W6QU66_9PSEU|nr:Fic family protein [Actinokineospora globicatena]MCP2302012.1 cell filamentation protein [Actinokineospora globicatena]GLW76326.1 Fic family protein [Actinokineospora globicatena]GLW83162.1 Fic family protein [Actinokineospora globicatena]GLW94870.1 Fic family protein [Actinokineospora globicatena]
MTDPYVDPATGVLRNIHDITDAAKLTEAERDLAFLRDEQLKRFPLPGAWDTAHLLAFHRHLFGDVYAWAGQPRQVDLSRDGSPFAHWRHVEPALADLFEKLRAERILGGLARPEFLARFTYYFAEVNVVHPFREGNGRTQRAFFRQLALFAGWRVDFSLVDRERYLLGCAAAMVGELGVLAEQFATALVGRA